MKPFLPLAPLSDLKGTLQISDYRSSGPRHGTGDKLTKAYLSEERMVSWGCHVVVGTLPHRTKMSLLVPKQRGTSPCGLTFYTVFFLFSPPEWSLGPTSPHGGRKKGSALLLTQSPGRAKGALGLGLPTVTRQSLGLLRLIWRVVRPVFSVRQGEPDS